MATKMKKLMIFAATILATLASCTNDSLDELNTELTTTITVDVNYDADQTRTYLDGNTIKWAETGEQLNVIYYADDNSSSRRQSATHTDYTLTEDGRARFTADFSLTDGASSYTLGAYYPYVYKYTTSSISLTLPQEQTPTAESYDPKTDILVSKEPAVVSGTPEKVELTFARMVAFAQMTLKGIEAGEVIEKVVFSSPAKPAGAVEFKVHEAATVENAKWYNNYEDITISRENWVATGEDVVWFTTVPTVLSDSEFTVSVTTNKSTYTKTVDLAGKTLEFQRGNVAQFAVSGLTKAVKPKAYKLLTDLSQLNAGDQVIFSTKKVESSSAKLLSTTKDGNALKFTESVTVTAALEILPEGLPADAALLTVEAGDKAGTFAFKDANSGYLTGTYDDESWASALTFVAEKELGSSWYVSLNSSSAVTAYAYYNDSTYRYLNNYYGSKFNFAGSTSTYYYYIYYIDGEGSGNEGGGDEPVVTPLATPAPTATVEGNTVTVSWAAIAGAKNYTVTYGYISQTVETTSATISDLEPGTYTFNVVANPADESVNSASEAGVVTATVEAQQGAEPQTVTIVFPIEGAVSGNSVGTIYEGDIKISSTGSWRTDNADGRDCIYIGRTTSNELRIEALNGKVITKVTLTPPVGYLIDLKWKEYDGYTSGTYSESWTGECKSRIVFTAAGSSHSNIGAIEVEYR